MHTKKIKFGVQKKNVFENVCLSTKFNLRLKKENQKNFWSNFKLTSKN